MTLVVNKMVRSRFRGCLLGALVGDCLGAPFEGDAVVGITFLANYMRKLFEKNRAHQIYGYTDDTAMAKSVCESLIESRKFDARDMAKRFTEEFLRAPTRGYGSTVKDTFLALMETDYEDPFGPAKEQFKGNGSLGNGAAMRVASVALFGYNLDIDEVINLARQQALITHSHPVGYNGAILECLAVHQALRLGSNANGNDENSGKFEPEQFKVDDFLDSLIEKMQPLEESSPKVDPGRSGDRIKSNKYQPQSQTPYTNSLKTMKNVLADQTQGSDLSPGEVVSMFGNSVSAAKSVPTAIYSFLRAHQPLMNFDSEDILLRTLFGAISVGGDTDTIATMACALVGAAYGEESIDNVLVKHCEYNEKVSEYADKLFDIVSEEL